MGKLFALIGLAVPASSTLIAWGALVAIVAGSITFWSMHEFNKGYARAVHDVAVQNQEAVDAVDKARARVRACNARDGMRWDQVAGDCVRGD